MPSLAKTFSTALLFLLISPSFSKMPSDGQGSSRRLLTRGDVKEMHKTDAMEFLRLGYNESCDLKAEENFILKYKENGPQALLDFTNKLCDPKQYLVCDDGACDCMTHTYQGYNLAYDDDEEKCMAVNGSRCDRQIQCGQNVPCVVNQCRCDPDSSTCFLPAEPNLLFPDTRNTTVSEAATTGLKLTYEIINLSIVSLFYYNGAS